MISLNNQTLVQFLREVDRDFEPALSTRVCLDNYAEKLINNAIITVESDSADIQGVCAVYATDKANYQAYMSMLAVHPNFRGKKIATKLVQVSEAKLKDLGFKSLRLETYKNNVNAISFYKKNGFQIIQSNENSFFFMKSL